MFVDDRLIIFPFLVVNVDILTNANEQLLLLKFVIDVRLDCECASLQTKLYYYCINYFVK